LRAEEVSYILADSCAAIRVCHADLLPQIRDALAKQLQLLVVATSPEIAAAFDVSADFVRVSWASWRDSYVPFQGTPRRGSPMFHMSGTTGAPKGVRRQPMRPEQIAAAGASAHEP
jgi:long-chain acyl-CoA synthetase